MKTSRSVLSTTFSAQFLICSHFIGGWRGEGKGGEGKRGKCEGWKDEGRKEKVREGKVLWGLGDVLQ